MANQTTSPNVPPPRNKALCSGVINHWFPVMRPEIKPLCLSRGAVGRPAIILYSELTDVLWVFNTARNFLFWEGYTRVLEGEKSFPGERKKIEAIPTKWDLPRHTFIGLEVVTPLISG